MKKGLRVIEVLPDAYNDEPTVATAKSDAPDDNWEDNLPEAPPMELTGDETVATPTSAPIPDGREP